MAKQKTSVTISSEALSILKALAQKYSVSRTAILEIAIREKAKSEGLQINDTSKS